MKYEEQIEGTKRTEQATSTSKEFNFELWARLVRPQLLASVQKRGGR